MEEIFPIVNEEGKVIGKASRQVCHSGSFLLHPVVHLHVLNGQNQLYLQKRANNKDIQPGKWDTSVGGHVDYNESIETALKREALEELGINDFKAVFAFAYPYRSDREFELVNAYYTVYEGIIKSNTEEIADSGFWSFEEIFNNMGKDIFTPNFEQEILKLYSILNMTK